MAGGGLAHKHIPPAADMVRSALAGARLAGPGLPDLHLVLHLEGRRPRLGEHHQLRAEDLHRPRQGSGPGTPWRPP